MAGDYEQLKRTIEDGVRAAEQLQKMLAEEKRKRRPRLKLIKGGLLVGAIWAGVEWLRDYKRVVIALAATGITATGAVIAEHPGSPGADPPRPGIIETPRQAPPKVRPSSRPRPTPTVTPIRTVSPRRTSPPQTQPMRVSPPESVETKARPSTTRTTRPSTTKPVAPPKTTQPIVTKTVSIPVTPTITTPPIIETQPAECAIVTVLGLCVLG